MVKAGPSRKIIKKKTTGEKTPTPTPTPTPPPPPVVPEIVSPENDFNNDDMYSKIKKRQSKEYFSSPIIKRKKMDELPPKKNTKVKEVKPKVKKPEKKTPKKNGFPPKPKPNKTKENEAEKVCADRVTNENQREAFVEDDDDDLIEGPLVIDIENDSEDDTRINRNRSLSLSPSPIADKQHTNENSDGGEQSAVKDKKDIQDVNTIMNYNSELLGQIDFKLLKRAVALSMVSSDMNSQVSGSNSAASTSRQISGSNSAANTSRQISGSNSAASISRREHPSYSQASTSRSIPPNGNCGHNRQISSSNSAANTSRQISGSNSAANISRREHPSYSQASTSRSVPTLKGSSSTHRHSNHLPSKPVPYKTNKIYSTYRSALPDNSLQYTSNSSSLYANPPDTSSQPHNSSPQPYKMLLPSSSRQNSNYTRYNSPNSELASPCVQLKPIQDFFIDQKERREEDLRFTQSQLELKAKMEYFNANYPRGSQGIPEGKLQIITGDQRGADPYDPYDNDNDDDVDSIYNRSADDIEPSPAADQQQQQEQEEEENIEPEQNQPIVVEPTPQELAERDQKKAAEEKNIKKVRLTYFIWMNDLKSIIRENLVTAVGGVMFEGHYPAIIAASAGHDRVLMHLVRNNVNMHVVSDYNGFNTLQTAVDQGHKNCVEILLLLGVDMSHISYASHTCLSIAMFRQDRVMVQMLLNYGCNFTSVMYGLGSFTPQEYSLNSRGCQLKKINLIMEQHQYKLDRLCRGLLEHWLRFVTCEVTTLPVMRSRVYEVKYQKSGKNKNEINFKFKYNGRYLEFNTMVVLVISKATFADKAMTLDVQQNNIVECVHLNDVKQANFAFTPNKFRNTASDRPTTERIVSFSPLQENNRVNVAFDADFLKAKVSAKIVMAAFKVKVFHTYR